MHTTEELLEISRSQFHLPEGDDITDEYVDAAEQVLSKRRRSERPFPVLRMVNLETWQTESVTAGAARLIVEGHLPITETAQTYSYDRRTPLIMAGVSILQMQLAEKVGLNAELAAISVPPFYAGDVGGFMTLGGWADDAYFVKKEDKKKTIAEIQSHLRGRYSQRPIFKSGSRETTFEITPMTPEDEARAEVMRILKEQGYTFTDFAFGHEGYYAHAPAERGIPTPIVMSRNSNMTLAANEALKVLNEDPNQVFGPQEYLQIPSSKTVTFG